MITPSQELYIRDLTREYRQTLEVLREICERMKRGAELQPFLEEFSEIAKREKARIDSNPKIPKHLLLFYSRNIQRLICG